MKLRRAAIERSGSAPLILVLTFILLGLLTGGLLSFRILNSKPADKLSRVALQDASKDDRSLDAPDHSQKLHKTTINPGRPVPRVDTGLLDQEGQAITVNCSSCHASRKPNFDNKKASDLKEFHQGISLTHGNISCLSCHNEKDYDTLKLADGKSVAYENVMEMCVQCHGPQAREFERGAHGGMQGYWDLTRGPRTKNNCVDCHAPHHPKFPKMTPDFKPKDRFLFPADKGGDHE